MTGTITKNKIFYYTKFVDYNWNFNYLRWFPKKKGIPSKGVL